jgi:recombinational DNA repair protein (RecF pathway)
MPSFSTEGIILKRVNFGETDRVLTVLTERFGKISVIAKGVRRITSRRAGNVEVLNRVRLHLFKARSYTLTEAESVETFQKLKENLTLTTYAFHIIELVDRLVPESQKNPYVYSLVLEILVILQTNPRQIFIRAFEVKLLSLLGFWSIEAVPNLNPELEEVLVSLQKKSWQEISALEVKEEVSLELERVLRYYIEKILESSLKSVQVLRKLSNG